jgi:hypothetical protein
MVKDYDLELPILRGAVWNNPRGAVIGGLIGAAVAGGFAAAVSGPFTAVWMALAAGWVSAYGCAIVEESYCAPGQRLFPRLHKAWTWLQWEAYGLVGSWRQAVRHARAALAELQWPGQGDQAGSVA